MHARQVKNNITKEASSVKRNKMQRKIRRSGINFTPKSFLWIIIIVSLFLVASTVAAWYLTKAITAKEAARRFNDEATVVESWITNRFETHKTILYGLQGFWSGSETVTKEEWQAYLEILKIKERFPGITSANFVRREDDAYIVTFVYPSEREAAVGTNLLTLPGRPEAINKAIDHATTAVTDKILLIADQKPGFAMMAPLYQPHSPLNTVEERRAAVQGLVSLAFRSEQVFKDLFDAHDPFPHLDFELYKGQVLEEDHILYDHDYSHYIPKIKTENRLETKRTITSDNETFTLLVSAKPSFGLTTAEKQLPNIVLIAGLALDGLISILALTEFRKL